MTRDELNKALLIERFAPRPKRTRTEVVVEQVEVYDDSDVTTARRRRELGEATSLTTNPKRAAAI